MQDGAEDGKDARIKMYLSYCCYNLMSCVSRLLRYTIVQRNKTGLTCGSPGICSGCSNGNNDTETDEQIELELHSGQVRWYWGRKGRAKEGQRAVYKPNGLVEERRSSFTG